jgi:AAA+ superfamily predicted ATPase
MSDDARVAALRAALAADPKNAALGGLLGDVLIETGDIVEALAAYRDAFAARALAAPQLVRAALAAMECGDMAFAGRLLDAAGTQAVGAEIDAARARLVSILARSADESRSEPVDPLPPAARETLALAPERRPRRPTRFADVAGNEDVKRAISRAIILPFQRPELYAAYGRRSGGGLLLYGPPGCGKTLLARATAGECGLPFLPVKVEDVLSPYRGESERAIRDAFESARLRAPCVLFLDELDALAYSRARRAGAEGRALVSVLLVELDGIESVNDGILVLAASNTPWDVDDALLRPGRFDRQLFVPPPDEAARRALLSALLGPDRARGADVAALAGGTDLFSGADIAALVERAVDEAIDEGLAAGVETPVRQDHLVRALRAMRPTTLDWLLSARNYAEFANAAGRYDEVAAFLRRRAVRRILSQ